MFAAILSKLKSLLSKTEENQELKYELLNDQVRVYCKWFSGEKKVFRIRALRNFSDVKRGDLGGFIENESNLSHCGDCWIYDDAMVHSNSVVYENAKVRNAAVISDRSSASGDAEISDEALIDNISTVYGNARISGNSHVTNLSIVRGSARISGNTNIRGHSIVE